MWCAQSHSHAHHNAGGGGRLKSKEVDSKLPYQAWPKVSDAWQRSGREVTTLIWKYPCLKQLENQNFEKSNNTQLRTLTPTQLTQIRCWSSRLAVTLVSRWSWMGTFSALMVLSSKALVWGQFVAGGVDEAVPPVVVTLALPVVGPEPTLWMVVS